MDLTYTSPIRFDFIPIQRSTIIFEFKLKASKNGIKVNIDVNIFFKDQFSIGRVSLINSGMQNVYTSTEMKTHKIEFKIPEFQNRTQSYVYISIEPIENFYDKAIVEDMRIGLKDDTNDKIENKCTHINVTMAIPHIEPKIGILSAQQQLQGLRDIIIKGYKDILKRVPDPIGLENYLYELKNGLSIESFYEKLKSSDEYRHNEYDPKIAITSIVRNEEENGNLKRFLACCKDLERYHNNIIYIFIEGDSSDRTYEVLKSWTEERNSSILKKINRGHSSFSKTRDTRRTVYFAELRNILVELALSIPLVAEILMIDANYGWRGDLIASLRETNADITAPLVVSHKDDNGRHIFYDVWVFRKNGKEFGPFYPYVEGMVFDKPVDIDSVGGGYLVKRNVLESGVRYNGDIDSEHVYFCKRAKSLGFTIKINPKIYIKKGGFA